MFFTSYTMLIVLLHTHEHLFFTFFKTHSGWPGVLKKKKILERVCNSTISMGEGGKT